MRVAMVAEALRRGDFARAAVSVDAFGRDETMPFAELMVPRADLLADAVVRLVEGPGPAVRLWPHPAGTSGAVIITADQDFAGQPQMMAMMAALRAAQIPATFFLTSVGPGESGGLEPISPSPEVLTLARTWGFDFAARTFVSAGTPEAPAVDPPGVLRAHADALKAVHGIEPHLIRQLEVSWTGDVDRAQVLASVGYRWNADSLTVVGKTFPTLGCMTGSGRALRLFDAEGRLVKLSAAPFLGDTLQLVAENARHFHGALVLNNHPVFFTRTPEWLMRTVEAARESGQAVMSLGRNVSRQEALAGAQIAPSGPVRVDGVQLEPSAFGSGVRECDDPPERIPGADLERARRAGVELLRIQTVDQHVVATAATVGDTPRQRGLVGETEPACDGGGAMILRVAVQLHALDADTPDRELHHRGGGLRHVALTPRALREPVADLERARAAPRVQAHVAQGLSVGREDAEDQLTPLEGRLRPVGDELQVVPDARDVPGPGHPGPKGLRVGAGEPPQPAGLVGLPRSQAQAGCRRAGGPGLGRLIHPRPLWPMLRPPGLQLGVLRVGASVGGLARAHHQQRGGRRPRVQQVMRQTRPGGETHEVPRLQHGLRELTPPWRPTQHDGAAEHVDGLLLVAVRVRAAGAASRWQHLVPYAEPLAAGGSAQIAAETQALGVEGRGVAALVGRDGPGAHDARCEGRWMCRTGHARSSGPAPAGASTVHNTVAAQLQ
jgi:hypothetical protein